MHHENDEQVMHKSSRIMFVKDHEIMFALLDFVEYSVSSFGS